MHLGQAADFLATVLSRSAPSVRMVSRILREGGWIEKGARGRNAPHLSPAEVARFLIALMCAPDSPTLASERLPHFLALSHEKGQATFGEAVAILLERLARDDWQDAMARDWALNIAIDRSAATIRESHPAEEAEPIYHAFGGLFTAPDDQPLRDAMPYFGGLEITVATDWLTLVRIAKVTLANEPDPVEEIAAALMQGK